MVALNERATAQVTADQPPSGGRWSGRTRKRRPKKRSMALRLPNSSAVHVGGRYERSMVRLGLKRLRGSSVPIAGAELRGPSRAAHHLQHGAHAPELLLQLIDQRRGPA